LLATSTASLLIRSLAANLAILTRKANEGTPMMKLALGKRPQQNG